MVNELDIVKLVEASSEEDKTTVEEKARRQNFCDSCKEKGQIGYINACLVDKDYTILKTTFIKASCPLSKWLV